MRQALVLSTRMQGTLVQTDQCDLGVVPKTNTSYEVALVKVKTKFLPVVKLFRQDKEAMFVHFSRGLRQCKTPENTSAKTQQFTDSVQVSFAQEDPRMPEVIISLNFRINGRRLHIEEITSRMELNSFFLFTLEDDDPAPVDESEVVATDLVDTADQLSA